MFRSPERFCGESICCDIVRNFPIPFWIGWRADRTTEKLDHRRAATRQVRGGEGIFAAPSSSSPSPVFFAPLIVSGVYIWCDECSAIDLKAAAQKVDGRFILILAISSTAFNIQLVR